MTRIVFLGAGSTVFAKNLMGDILGFPELANANIVLHDIDAERLRTSEIVAHKVARALNANPKIETIADRRAALDGADFALSMFQVGGYRPSTVIDFEIPKKYGLRQTIADTLGIGGIMRALRTIPVLLDMCIDMEQLCPNVMFLNYVNPMVMNCWAIARASKIRTVGLCHSVPNTAHELARDLELPPDEIDYLVAGINHMAFYLKLEHQGENLYPRLREFMQSEKFPPTRGHMTDHVRYEMFKRLGYFVTESSEHFSEYVPWFIKSTHPELIERFEIPLDEYIIRCEENIAQWESTQREMQEPHTPIQIKRSVEYGSNIIHAMVTGQPTRIYGNMPNDGIIDNLPHGVPVEVPCLVDKNGVQPVHIGALPPHLAALMQTNINVQALAVEAALTRKREHIYHAAMLDPHTAAELTLDQIWAMVDELLDAHGAWLPQYQ